MVRPVVSAVLNAHREGMIAKPSMESLKRSIAHAERAGHTIEVHIVLDRADSTTAEVISNAKLSHHYIHETNFGDLGMARNFAVSNASGEYIALLDADDLWGVDWLTKAIAAARSRNDNVIWHPEISVYFGAAKHIFRHIDMESQDFDPLSLFLENHWTSLSFSTREIYMNNPYPTTDLRAGFGFEDWAWNLQTTSGGILHKTVAGTGHVIRRKPISLAQQTVVAQAVTRPNDYLSWIIKNRINTKLVAD